MLPLFANSKAAPVFSGQENNNNDITKFINSFEPFNSFGEISFNNNRPDSFSSRALHKDISLIFMIYILFLILYIIYKDNLVSRNIHMTNVLADVYSDIMEIINRSGTIFYINSKYDSLYTRMIIVIFYDLRDAINCYNNIEKAFKSCIVLDETATSIFGLKLSDIHKTKFYLTLLAPNSKLRDSKYLVNIV
ncbi:hypothetical protein BJ944DRAFT_228971 [Cunninghamella echinulata]|nr:hypothetical protein BJ944DRAFT_228971 [Cunninghamella echinulata]